MTADNMTETHKPMLRFDGIQHLAACTCGWRSAHWRNEREQSELEWGQHGVSTIRRNVNNRSSFTIIGNPLAKKEA